MIEVMERASEQQRKEMIELLRRADSDNEALDKLHNIVVEGGGLGYAAEVLKSYLTRAMHLIHKYEETPFRKSLLDLCTFIAERDR